MKKKHIVLVAGIVAFALSLCFIRYVMPEKTMPDDSGINSIEKQTLSLSNGPLKKPQDCLADTGKKTRIEASSLPQNIDTDNDWMYDSEPEPRSLDEMETFLAEVHKPMVLQPKSKLSRLRNTEPNEVRAYLDLSRQNYEQIQNIHTSFSGKTDDNTYSLKGEIVAEVYSGKYDYVTLDLNTSSGGRLVHIFANGVVMAGYGDCEESVAIEVYDKSDLPADPMFHDVLWREYKLAENEDKIADQNVVCLQSGPYTLWVNKNTKLISRYKLKLDEEISKEVIITKYKPYFDELYYPEEMIVNETSGDDTRKFTYSFTNVAINLDKDTIRKVKPRQNTHYRIKKM
jgi:hypothetical protein